MAEIEETSRFGQYAILGNIEHKFAKDPKKTWMFRPSTSKDELGMTVFSTTQNQSVMGGVTLTRYPNRVEIMWREIAYLTVASNIPTQEISAGVAPVYLPENPKVSDVEGLLAQMPHEMVLELWGKLGECNPGWGPAKEKKA
jgi:hypothetical protein